MSQTRTRNNMDYRMGKLHTQKKIKLQSSKKIKINCHNVRINKKKAV